MVVVVPVSGAASPIEDLEEESLRLEQTAEGEITVLAPTWSDTGLRNGELYGQVYVWNKQSKLGYAFDSSTGFTLPNGAKYSPDVSWIKKPRWDALTKRQKNDFAPLRPGFAVGLRSRSDRLTPLQRKMTEYMENGARLGWLIDPQSHRLEIYRPGQDVEVLEDPATVSGEDVLPGFVLDLTRIFP